MKKLIAPLLIAGLALAGCNAQTASKTDGGVMGTFTNPVLYADVPDPCLIRVDSFYYMISTTMHLMPGAPVMKSKDLVNWETVSYVFQTLTDTPKYDMENGTVYGRGQWASSIRYHNGRFYVFFSPNDEPYRGYIYTTTDPEKEPWTLVSRVPHFHDCSLFFDDDGRVYMFYGTGELRELNADLSDVKEGGIRKRIIERDATETGLLEGTHALKKDGKYYVMMISMVYGEPGRIRREVCYRADNIEGPYEKKVILESEFEEYGGVGQGFIVDTPEGDWYGVIFQDRGGVGRVPILMPCHWIDGWPMLGNEDGSISKTYEKILYPNAYNKGIVGSDDFGSDKLSLYWQWNHNPVNDKWSLAERPGYLRLKTARVTDNLFAARNTITQRTIGPKSGATVSLDLSGMIDGDVAGFSAFNGHSGTLSVRMEGNKKTLVMTEDVINFDPVDREKDKIIKDPTSEEKERVAINQDNIYLRIDCDFTRQQELATFYYSLDNVEWKKIGSDFRMRFDYRRFFMGTKFAIFNYATKTLGGHVDVDYFDFTEQK
ncbi:glycoside hydrolase 43 family protein [Bacteroides sp. 51]|uniref:glycoside hydrolase family 43 protein n=1 Tax=Bacteroides sp. 51 TaxID=2302938 RepID=UPI00351BB5A4